MPAPQVLSLNSDLRHTLSSGTSWSSGAQRAAARPASLTARSQIRSPALWVLVWLSAAAGFLIGYSDGPGASFVPVLSAKSSSGVFQSVDPIHCHFKNMASEAYILLKPAASSASALLMAFLARRVGRKNTISVGAAVYVVACLVQAFKPSQAQLFAGRALLGVSEGLLMTVYVGSVELASKYNRGTIAGFDAFGRGIGMLCQGMIAFGVRKTGVWGWCVYSLFGAVIGGFVFCLLNFGGLPDTPASLVQRGHLEEARESLQMLRNLLMAAETAAEYQMLLHECALTTLKRGPFARRWLPRTLLAVYLALTSNFVGAMLTKHNIPAVLARTVAVDSTAWSYLVFMVMVGGGWLSGALVALLTADRVGRRTMLTAICVVFAVLSAIAAVLVETGASSHTLWGMTTLLVVQTLRNATHAAGPQAIMLIYTSEIQPLATRTLVFGSAVAVIQLLQAVLQIPGSLDLCRHSSHTFFRKIAISTVCAVLMWVLLPETARLDSDEIDRAFDRHWLWGRFSRPPAEGLADGLAGCGGDTGDGGGKAQLKSFGGIAPIADGQDASAAGSEHSGVQATPRP